MSLVQKRLQEHRTHLGEGPVLWGQRSAGEGLRRIHLLWGANSNLTVQVPAGA